MRASLMVAGLILVELATGCRRAPDQAASAGVDNHVLGIRLAALPEGFAVASNGPDGIVLARGREPDGRLVVTASPVEGAVNLVEAVKARQRAAETSGGRFLGSRELRTPWGAAFTARSRPPATDGGLREETAVFALHPGNPARMLVATYSYPAGEDTTARIQQLLDVVAQIDPLGPAAGAR
jgi:hypothetical protein